ncbi:hypothetical protein [Pseudopontixanthobacter vadosimaris]|uniref:hypothetical protein n=1 Tax=Pseudopontixanthobacter vadosimaris TaxID=2726450 RepID=UPI001473CA0A|nr:hypothetical protein [Pseudopontixanthobacter vadosimaris]
MRRNYSPTVACERRPIVGVRFTVRRGSTAKGGRQRFGNWTTEGDNGVALIELAPTMVSGPLRLAFAFADDEISLQQELKCG